MHFFGRSKKLVAQVRRKVACHPGGFFCLNRFGIYRPIWKLNFISTIWCFIEGKRHIREWLPSGGVFGWEAHPGNINFARCFHRFSPRVSLLWFVGISFCPNDLSHTAAAAARISESMQRRDIRMAVQILVIYRGKTSISAVVSYLMSALITKHSRRIAFHVANSSFFEHQFWLSKAR